ncbi:MAG: hypothetical protein PCFJNLEI_00776 [Verrucomicrobiae bacterium]|nr:hypothetical protein [Verrucomicrobiae bacterium]
MKKLLLLAFLVGTAHAQQNLIPNADFSGPDPLKGWRIDFPYQSRYVKNASYIRATTQLGRKCVELNLPPGVAGNEGGKIETALIPCQPGATYRVEIDVLTWDFGAKLHAEAYTTDPRPDGQQNTSLFIIPGTNGAPAKVMCYRAQIPDPPGRGKQWSTVKREFTLPATVKVAGKDCPPEWIVLKAVFYAGTMSAGKSYVTNFRLYKVK